MTTQGWAIKGVHGFYVGWYLTKRDAINEHCEALGKTWVYCRAKGDRCVRVSITELISELLT